MSDTINRRIRDHVNGILDSGNDALHVYGPDYCLLIDRDKPSDIKQLLVREITMIEALISDEIDEWRAEGTQYVFSLDRRLAPFIAECLDLFARRDDGEDR